MTLAPLVAPDIRGIEGRPGDVQGECVSPGCSSSAQQRHHLWSRAYLRGQPIEWVRVPPNGTVLQNSVGLCVECHAAVTGDVGGHRAHIRYNQGLAIFEWWAKRDDDSWFYVGPLKKQQFLPEMPEAMKIRAQEGLCPECGKPLASHPTSAPPRPRRKVTTWGVSVPADSEIGSDIMDDWIDQFAVMLGFGDATSRLKRYHVLVIVLAWAMQNKAGLLTDLEEAEFFSHP